MTRAPAPEVGLRPWAAGDLPLLERLLGDPRMTEHLGGPESPAQLRKRNEDYSTPGGPGTGQMFVITLGPGGEGVGSVGYWSMEWRGETVWETGWSVLPAFQGMGIATVATTLVVEQARAEGLHSSIHAFPSVDNGPSNAICRKAGFTFLGASDFEYPKGNFIRCNDWALDLSGESADRAGTRGRPAWQPPGSASVPTGEGRSLPALNGDVPRSG